MITRREFIKSVTAGLAFLAVQVKLPPQLHVSFVTLDRAANRKIAKERLSAWFTEECDRMAINHLAGMEEFGL